MTRRPDELVAEWHRLNLAGMSFPKIAKAAGETRGAAGTAVHRYRRDNGLKGPGKGHHRRSAASYAKQRAKGVTGSAVAGSTTPVKRDGVRITICPPGYAEGYGWTQEE